MEFIANFIARFREPSSWAGIGVLLATFGVDLGDELLDAIALVGAGLAAGLYPPQIPKGSVDPEHSNLAHQGKYDLPSLLAWTVW